MHPHASLHMVDASAPRDLLGSATRRAAAELGRQRRRRMRALDDVSAGRSGAEQRLAMVDTAIARLEGYIIDLEEYRCAGISIDCQRNGSLGPAWKENARRAAEEEERQFSEYTRGKLAEHPVLAGLLRTARNEEAGIQAVYTFADLTAGERECIWLEHRGGLHATAIAALTHRQPEAAAELLRRAHVKLRQVAEYTRDPLLASPVAMAL